METKLQQEINKVLKVFPEYWQGDTLLKNNLIEDIRTYNEKIIDALLSNQLIKNTYALQLSSGLVFKTEDFISMLRFKNYWDNSYTKYTNEIGLTSEGKYLKYNTDIVLDFPHKDGILEGGMSKEDVGKKEIYYHNVIAKEEIDILLAPKTLVNAKRYTQNGEQEATQIDDTDNLIIKGNNLIALHTLKEKYSGSIKLIYIDPPYNTGGDSFKYNDRFNHSTWLTFMKNRLEIASKLLSEDGTICISIDSKEIAYLITLMDEIFGKSNLKNIITVKRSSVSGAKVINPGVVNVSEFVLIYSKNSNLWKPNRVYKEKARDPRYNQFIKNIDDSPEDWEYETILDAFSSHMNMQKSQLKKKLGSDYNRLLDEFVYNHKENIIRFAALDDSQIGARVKEAKYISKETTGKTFIVERDGYKNYYLYNGNALLFFKDRLIEVDGKLSFGELISDIWDDVLPNDLHNEGGVTLKKGKKTEKLIERIIKLCTDEGDIVLDFFAGTGTTAGVALKTKRKFLVVEQLDYVEHITKKRLINVINGEQSGVSKNNKWDGGGSFVYAELYDLNNTFIKEIKLCQSLDELKIIINKMKISAHLNFRVELEKVTTENHSFQELSLEEQKQTLIDVLDMNQLYLNYSEIEDSQYAISDSVKSFNHSFYQKEGDQHE